MASTVFMGGPDNGPAMTKLWGAVIGANRIGARHLLLRASAWDPSCRLSAEDAGEDRVDVLEVVVEIEQRFERLCIEHA
jgi:hypothetical protein